MALVQSSSASLNLQQKERKNKASQKQEGLFNVCQEKVSLLLQLEISHGSVGGQQHVHVVCLHTSGVALYSCFIFPFFEVGIPLETQ